MLKKHKFVFIYAYFVWKIKLILIHIGTIETCFTISLIEL